MKIYKILMIILLPLALLCLNSCKEEQPTKSFEDCISGFEVTIYESGESPLVMLEQTNEVYELKCNVDYVLELMSNGGFNGQHIMLGKERFVIEENDLISFVSRNELQYNISCETPINDTITIRLPLENKEYTKTIQVNFTE